MIYLYNFNRIINLTRRQLICKSISNKSISNKSISNKSISNKLISNKSSKTINYQSVIIKDNEYNNFLLTLLKRMSQNVLNYK
jgi:hypothetical protein